MSARKGSISRVTVPTPRVEPLVIGGDSGRPERPIQGVLKIVWRGRWIILFCLIVSFAIGMFKLSVAKPRYHSWSQIVLQGTMPSVVGDVISPTGQAAGYLYTQCEIINSTALLTKALKEPGVADANCLKGMDNPVGFLKTAVGAAPETEGNIITVGMDASDPNDAATIVNGVVNAYRNFQSEQHQQTSLEVQKIIESDIKTQQAELKQEQEDLLKFKKDNPELTLDAGDKGTPAALVAMLNKAQLRTINFQIASEEATGFLDDPVTLKRLVDEANSNGDLPPDTQPMVDQLTLDDIRLTENALHNFGAGEANNAFALRLREKLQQDYLDKSQQLAASSKRYVAYLSKQFDASQTYEGQLKKIVDANKTQAMETNSKQAEYDQLVDKIKNTNRALDALYQREKTVNPQSDVGVLTVQVLEPAKASNDSVGTKRSNALGMALVAGLMVGLGASFLVEVVDQRLRTVEDVTRRYNTAVLGTVSHIRPGQGWVIPYSLHDFRVNWRRYSKTFIKNLGRKPWGKGQSPMQCGQAMQLQPRSDVAEAYRAIRTAIYFGLSGHYAKTILVTSPGSGDGKTTLASNLAIAIAQTGRRVLLIDADCWRPAQQDIFGLTEDGGLTDVLKKKKTLAQAVHKTDVENLEILPCGELPLNPAEMLESQTFFDMLNFAAEQYDQILIDSPPVVPITDARILAARCDATILVLRANKSTRHQADSAFEALNAVGAPILGIVMNDAPRVGQGNSYQYYHYAAHRDRSDWDQYTPAEIMERRNGNGHHNGNGNHQGYARHLPGEEIIDADEEIETE